MAKISLRVYNREIEGLIEGGQLDEAVAHCQHILKTFSMHIETYQLLGKAFLEAHRYTDAADIFQRVLNAAPDDFVAHVGMSIIRDDEGKLDEAIWHMERAFEVQPSNPAIQGELRRLYGRRDGVEPPKIRLSRDALANMYAQGELFNQAIAEIRAVLADDPDRPDLQVMLARAYFRIGQKVEAAEMAAQLLKKYPYCLDALRVLVEVLPGTARAENTQVYRQRLRLLDPYSSFVSGSVFASDQVADASVNLERLEYHPGKQATLSQPTWSASLGVKLDEEKHDASHPVWLSNVQAETPAEATPPFPGSGPIQEGKAIPDFLRAAGWGESDRQPSGGELGLGDASPAEGIAKGEMPDWLKSQIPPELSVGEKPAEEPVPDEGGDFPDWLTGLSAAASAATIVGEAVNEQPAQEVPTEQESFAPLPETEIAPDPDFLTSLPSEPESALAVPLETGEARPVSIEDDTMSWLEGLAAEQGAKPEESLTKPEERFEELPDWLKKTVEEQPLVAVQPPAPELQPAEAGESPLPEKLGVGPVETMPLPDLRSALHVTEESLPEEAHPPSTPDGGTAKPLGIEDDTMAWLEGLAAKQGAKPEELLTKPEERSDELPDWLKKTAEEQPLAAAQPPAPEPQPAKASEPPVPEKSGLGPVETMPLPDLRSALHVTEESLPEEAHPPSTSEEGPAKPLGIEDDSMAWLEGQADTQTAKTKERVSKPEECSKVMPDWLQKTTQELETAPENRVEPEVEIPIIPPEMAAEEAIISQEVLASSPESPLEAALEEQPPVSAEEDITITTWLKNLDESSATTEIPTAPSAPEPSIPTQVDIPDWLKDFEKQPAQPEPAMEEKTSRPEADLPEWLLQPAAPVPEQPAPQPSHAEAELPEWTLDDAEPVEQPDPTIPAEWMPVEKQRTVPEPAEETPPELETAAILASPPAPPLVSKGTGILSPIPAQDKDAIILSGAQKLLESNHLDEAMKEYSKLIRKGRLLDEVIHDLREALYRFPVDIIVWQSLGDAYMRANRLQDALDAYTKAEELLR